MAISSCLLEKKLAEVSSLETKCDELELKICDTFPETFPEDWGMLTDDVFEKLQVLGYELELTEAKLSKAIDELDEAIDEYLREEMSQRERKQIC